MAWVAKTSLPAARGRISQSGVWIPTTNQIAVYGGYTGVNSNDVLVYDIDTDTWTTKSAVYPFSLPYQKAFYLDSGYVAIVDGSGSAGWRITNDFTNFSSYTSKGDHSYNIDQADVAVCDGTYIYVVEVGNPLQIHRWEPIADVWDAAILSTNTSTPLNQPAVGLIGGKIYIMGGNDSAQGGSYSVIRSYDIAGDSFTIESETMTSGRRNMSSAVFGSVLYTVGGITSGGSGSASCFRYTPATDTVAAWDAYPLGYSSLGAMVPTDTGIYYIGGTVSSTLQSGVYYQELAGSPQTVSLNSVDSAEAFGNPMIVEGSGRAVNKRPGFIPIF